MSSTARLTLRAAVVDLERQQVVRDGEPRSLTSMETALLRFLAARPGEAVSRDTLLAEVWSYRPGTKTRAVDFTVHRLRRKIEVDPSEPDHLLTVHGEGYRLALPEDASAAAGASNLPPEAGRFFGREALLQQLQLRLAGGARLVTLHGPGGAGKTRLALRLAAQSVAAHPGGVWLVELASARSAPAMVYAVARALSIPLSAPDEAGQRAELVRHLRGRGPTLLLLDNFEQLVDAGAPIVSELLAGAPGLRALATSQQRLGLPGEQAVSVAALGRAAGAALFEDRAAQACPGFTLNAADRLAVAEIVERLDGLPLAIELAAGRAAVLSPTEIRDRLSSRFSLLRGLSGVIERSWALLAPWEQQALAQLSVFRGGFTLAAAEAVLELEGVSPLDALQALTDKALLQRRPREGAAPRRLALGESIRLFAAARLAEGGGRPAVRARHRAYYLRRWRLTDRSAYAASPADREALAADLDNLVAVWRRALADDPASAVEALQALRPLFLARGPSRALLALLDQAIAHAPGVRLAAEALHARAGVRLLLGQLQGALDDLDDALALLDPEQPDALLGAVLTERGLALDRLGRAAEAEPAYARARAALEATGDRAGLAMVDGYRGTCRFNQGDLDGAQALLERSLAESRATGQLAFAGAMAANLGSVYFKRERLDDAEAQYRRALAIFQAEGDVRREGMGRILLGLACVLQGRLDEAEAHLEEGVALQERIGAQRGHGIALGWLGMMHHLRGDLDEAEPVYAASVEALSASGDVHHQTFVCSTWAMLRAATGDLAGAAEQLAQAELLGAGSPLPAHASGLALARLFLAAARPGADRAVLRRQLADLPPATELAPFWDVLRRQLRA